MATSARPPCLGGRTQRAAAVPPGSAAGSAVSAQLLSSLAAGAVRSGAAAAAESAVALAEGTAARIDRPQQQQQQQQLPRPDLAMQILLALVEELSRHDPGDGSVSGSSSSGGGGGGGGGRRERPSQPSGRVPRPARGCSWRRRSGRPPFPTAAVAAAAVARWPRRPPPCSAHALGRRAVASLSALGHQHSSSSSSSKQQQQQGGEPRSWRWWARCSRSRRTCPCSSRGGPP